MSTRFFLSTLVLVALGVAPARAQTTDSLKQTLACHGSYKNVASPTYEVFEREGFVFIRQLKAHESNKTTFSLLLSEGENLYEVDIQVPRFYWQDHKFQLLVPGSDGKERRYCVSYYADPILPDQVNKFQKSPPAACDAYPVQKATALQASKKSEAVERIQDKMISNMREQIDIATRGLSKPGQTNEEARLQKFHSGECAKLERFRMKRTLDQLAAFRNKLRETTTQSPGAKPSAPSEGRD
jgi:hypothetical protein